MSKPAPYDDLQTSSIALVGFLACILTFALVLATQAFYFQFQDWESQRKLVDTPRAEAESILSGQRSKLNGYSWVDREKQVVSIPIDEAMKIVIRENNVTAANQAPSLQ